MLKIKQIEQIIISELVKASIHKKFMNTVQLDEPFVLRTIRMNYENKQKTIWIRIIRTNPLASFDSTEVVSTEIPLELFNCSDNIRLCVEHYIKAYKKVRNDYKKRSKVRK